MAGINVVVTDGTTGGINTNVLRVISQTVETTAAPFTMQANRGYILTNNGIIQDVFFPASPLVGDIYYLQGRSAQLFKLGQYGTQQILFGDKETVAGGLGFIESTNKNDSMFLICVVAAGTASVFSVMPGAQGNFNMNTAGGVVSQNSVNNAGGGAPASGSNGSLYLAISTTQALTGGVDTLWTSGFLFDGAIMDDFTRATTRLTYTGIETKNFKISMQISNVDVHDGTFRGSIRKNGAAELQSFFNFANRTSGGGDTAMTSTGSVDLTLSTNDYVEPYVVASNSVTLGINTLTLFANQLI